MLGLILTLLYVLTAYLAPTTIFGDLAQYRIEFILAVLTLVASIPRFSSADILRCVQTYALPALALGITMSISANGWIGGGPVALLEFIPNIAAFFFVSINLRTVKHVRMLLVVLFFAAAFVIAHAAYDIHAHDPFSPYLLSDKSAAGDTFYRIRGLALINDPNDLGQFLIALVPCMFFFWSSGRVLRNLVTVILPVLVLITGLYLTHSRGAMLALLMVVLLASRRKIGTVPAAVTAGLLFLGFTAAGWSGGRDISADAGSDRMEAWFTGLEMLRAHPLIGVGYTHFQDYYEITAHNTIIVCSAETGIFGYFCWMLFVLPTVRDAIAGSEFDIEKQPAKNEQPESEDCTLSENLDELDRPGSYEPEANGYGLQKETDWTVMEVGEPQMLGGQTHESHVEDELPTHKARATDSEEVRRLCGIMVLSMSGFLTAGWFLSRAFVLSLFLLGGIVSVVYRLARQDYARPPLTLRRASSLSAMACGGSLVFMYLLLRVTGLAHH